MKKVRGNTVGTTMPRPDFKQDDPKKADFIKNRPLEQLLPEVTADDDGKTLRVVNGKWTLVMAGDGETPPDYDGSFDVTGTEGTFTLSNSASDSGPFTFEVGMTWEQFVESGYNPMTYNPDAEAYVPQFFISDSLVYFRYTDSAHYETYLSDDVSPTDVITDGRDYYCDDY